MKIPLIIAALLFAAGAATDASAIRVQDFLATATDDSSLGHQSEQIDFLAGSSSNTPFFDRVEFRTETDDFEFPRQRYSLRFYPNGWGETAHGKKVYETTLAYSETQRDLLLHLALKKRYTLVIDYLHVRDTLELTKKLLVLYEDRVHVFTQRSDSVDFDVNDLIEAEDDYTRLQLALIDLENRISSIEDAIRIVSPEDASLEFDAGNLAGIAAIQKYAKNVDGNPPKDTVHLRNSRARLELARWRYELEKSTGKKYLSYFEAHYDNEERHDTSEAVSLEVGIRFPFVDANRLDTNRRMLSYLSEKGAYAELERTLSEKATLLSKDLQRLMKQQDLLASKKEGGSRESYRHLEGADPLILLKMKESTLKRDISSADLQHQLYTKYIELLDVMGKLSEKPLRNYLSSTLEQLAP